MDKLTEYPYIDFEGKKKFDYENLYSPQNNDYCINEVVAAVYVDTWERDDGEYWIGTGIISDEYANINSISAQIIYEGTYKKLKVNPKDCVNL